VSHTLVLLFSWGAPPLLGALIGYAASRIAVGVILRRVAAPGPSGAALPRALGGIVSRALRAEDRLRAFAQSQGSARAIGSTVSRLTDAILSRPVGDLLRAATSDPALSPRDLVTRAVKRLLASRQLIHVVRDVMSRIVASLGARPMREVIEAVGLESLVTERIIPRLAAEPGRASLSKSIAAFLGDRAAGLVSDDVLEEIPRLLTPLVPDAVDAIVQWLRAEETRAYLAAQGRELLPRILEKLNALQKLFLSAAQYDRRLTEQMPEIVDETVLTLERIVRDPAQQRRVLELARGIVRDWRDGLGVRRIEGGRELANETRLKLEESAARIMERLLRMGEDPERRRSLYAGLLAALRVDQQNLGGFIRQTAGVTEADLVDALSTALLTWLTRDGTAEKVGTALCAALPGIGSDSALRDILHVDAAGKAGMDARIVSLLQRIIPTVLPELVKTVDVESLVSRVWSGGGFPARLGAPARKWACLFGTLLGCLIGLLQLLLRLVPVS
jgi:hypothetical protein